MEKPDKTFKKAVTVFLGWLVVFLAFLAYGWFFTPEPKLFVVTLSFTLATLVAVLGFLLVLKNRMEEEMKKK